MSKETCNPRKLTKLSPEDEIVISGIAGRFPESDNLKLLQENLMNKVDLVTEDCRRWNIDHPHIPKSCGKINGIDKFDSLFFGVHAKQAQAMDPVSRMLLEHTYEAIVDAGVNPRKIRGGNTGVFIGSHISESENHWLYDKNQTSGGIAVSGCNRAMLANRISYWLGVNGPSYTVDTACSSSLFAMEHAYRAMREGLCDSAIVGGGNLCLHPYLCMHYFELGVLSKDGRCKSFDESANGYVRSEAVSVIFLQKTKDAKRIYATVVHAKTNCDGFKDQGITFPSSHMQSVLLQEFYLECGLSPSAVNYVEAHGTGTKVGDPEEMNTIDSVFTPGRESTLKIGSIKSNLGHTEPASGLCGIAKAIIAMESGLIPPNLHYKEPRKGVQPLEEGRLTVVTEPTIWERGYVAINSFGFGGANAHLLLKSNSKEKVNNGTPNDNLPRLVIVSGRTEDAVSTMINELNSKPTDIEYVKLFHDIHTENIHGHLYRGFTILPSHRENYDNPIYKIKPHRSSKRPVWFIFSGVGSQWPGMGESLLRLPIFADTIKKCDVILKPLGIDIFHIITNKNEKDLENNINLVLGIAAVQIGLVNVLRSIGIVPDKIVGHSLGELACAYADDCLTLEQMILAAYSRGKAFSETDIIFGSMAAVGLSYEEVQSVCPSDIDIACYNMSDNITLSGPADSIKTFVSDMMSKRIFSREVPCGNVPYHSRYISEVGPRFLAYLQKVISDPKPRSSKWLSTSVSIDKWDTPLASFSSPEYHANNVLNVVQFKQVLDLIPENAITIEIAPHSLFNAILQRSLNPNIKNITLTKKNSNDGLEILLQGIGEMFTVGLQPQLANLYPNVELPVSRSTSMISPLIKWEHSTDWFVSYFEHEQNNISGGRAVKISLSDKLYKPMVNHIIDGKNILPYAAYLTLVWETLGIMHDKLFTQFSVTFKDIRFIRSISIPENESIDLIVSIQKGTGKFEIIESEEAVATGYVHASFNSNVGKINFSPDNIYEEESMTSSDVYKELRLRGYNYDGLYKSIKSASINGSKGHIIWQNDWNAFIENMLQMYFLGIDTRNLFVPTVIKKLIINTEYHNAEIEKYSMEEGLPVYVDRCLNRVICSGIEISGLKANSTVRRKLTDIPLVEEYKFISYYDKAETSVHEILRLVIQTISENYLDSIIKIIELSDEISGNDFLIPKISEVINETMLIQADFSILGTNVETEDESFLSKVYIMNPSLVNAKTNALLAIGNQILTKSREDSLNLLLLALSENGFLLTCETIEETVNLRKVAENNQLDIILEKTFENKIFILLRKRVKISENISIVHISNDSFDWLQDMQRFMQESLNMDTNKYSRVIFVCQNEFENGLLGFINCLRKEQGGDNVRGFLIQDPNAPKFSLQNPFYYNQVQKDLVINVLRENGNWGAYRYQLLPALKSKKVEKAYVNQLIRGDLTSLVWLEDPRQILPDETNLIDTYYSSINYKDIMLATGKLSVESIINDRLMQKYIFGTEYCGIDKLGNRKMGLITNGTITNKCVADPILTWTIPSDWSLEDGSTVPMAYAIACDALYNKYKIKKGETLLIHEGDSDVGQAAINLALHEGCVIFTTVNSAEKHQFICKNFPQIPISHIEYLQDSNFEQMIMTQTKGCGVNMVLNTNLTGENFQESINCLANGGRFLQIDKYNIIPSNSLEMNGFLHEISFQVINLDRQLNDCIETKLEIQKLITNGLRNGSIKPISRIVYSKDDLETAFSSTFTYDRIGKILLKIRDETNPNALIPALPRYHCLENRSYIILGGLGGYGLELADWLVLRGAKNLVLVSRSGIKNAYQRMRVNLWQSYGIRVVIVVGKETLTRDECQSIIEEAQKLAPVDGFFNLTAITKDGTWNNQSKESYELVFRIKAWATKHFDELTRKLCPELRHFVVFSSYSCRGIGGQTNYGMASSAMERICEKRASEGFPVLAVQWGLVGDVGFIVNAFGKERDVQIGGCRQQPISSCLHELEQLMLQERPVVSCLVLAEKTTTHTATATILESVLSIMGIKDLKGVGLNTPLPELGLDSMMTVDIVHTLERSFSIILTCHDIRSLNFAKIQEMSDSN